MLACCGISLSGLLDLPLWKDPRCILLSLFSDRVRLQLDKPPPFLRGVTVTQQLHSRSADNCSKNGYRDAERVFVMAHNIGSDGFYIMKDIAAKELLESQHMG